VEDSVAYFRHSLDIFMRKLRKHPDVKTFGLWIHVKRNASRYTGTLSGWHAVVYKEAE